MFRQTSIFQTIRHIPWLYDLSDEKIRKLADIASFYDFSLGAELFHEGDREISVHILLDGQISLEVTIPTQGCLRLGLVEPLDVIGWSALTPVVRQRTATARATKPGSTISFSSNDTKQLCENDHDIGYAFHKKLSDVIATRLLLTRLQLYEVILQTSKLNPESNNFSG